MNIGCRRTLRVPENYVSLQHTTVHHLNIRTFTTFAYSIQILSGNWNPLAIATRIYKNLEALVIGTVLSAQKVISLQVYLP